MQDPFGWHPEPELVNFLDPTVSRDPLKELGRAAWDASLEWLYAQALRRPVAPDSYGEMRRDFFGDTGVASPAPRSPQGSKRIFEEFRRRIAPYLFSAQHPRSWSYFTGPALPMSIAGELMAQWTNQSVDVWQAGPIAALVEEEVTQWLRDLVGMPKGGWGVLTSGGAMANTMGMTLARDVHLARLRETGQTPRGSLLEGVRVYVSDQAHFSIGRALELLGYPAETLRVLPTDDRFRLRGATLARAVARDRASGLVPLAAVAVAGTTNTGSVDPVGELADVAARENLWLHVDAAYGAAARLSPRCADRVPDLERADSITVDPHKWFFQPYDIGGLVVRRGEDLLSTFHREPEYYRTSQPGEAPLHWYRYTMEGSRRFRALKLWMSWKHLGTEGLGRLVERNIDLAAHLARLCREAEDFEVVPGEPDLSIVCFRHLPQGLRDAQRDVHQDRLQRALEMSGEGWVSTTMLRGQTYLRAGIVNYLSTEADVDAVLEALRRLSRGIAKEDASAT